jgi:hypothetical protein
MQQLPIVLVITIKTFSSVINYEASQLIVPTPN